MGTNSLADEAWNRPLIIENNKQKVGGETAGRNRRTGVGCKKQNGQNESSENEQPSIGCMKRGCWDMWRNTTKQPKCQHPCFMQPKGRTHKSIPHAILTGLWRRWLPFGCVEALILAFAILPNPFALNWLSGRPLHTRFSPLG